MDDEQATAIAYTHEQTFRFLYTLWAWNGKSHIDNQILMFDFPFHALSLGDLVESPISISHERKSE